MLGKDIGKKIIGLKGEEFRLADSLGRGAFGEVYRAIGKTSGLVVAVKLLSEGQFDGVDAENSLINEATLAREIQHPNVVSVLHSGVDPVLGPFVIMEFVPGGTLKSLLRAQSGRPLELGRASQIMLQIAQGTRAINERLIHRDIKPDNILVSGDLFKVGDFGISKIVAERTRTRTFKGIGPLSHMAPEVWQSDTHTIKLDVYSVGLVFFEILTLRHPLEEVAKGPSLFDAWRNAHVYHPIPDLRTFRPDVPLAIAQLIARMTAKRPQDRPGWDEIIGKLSSVAPDADDSSPTKQLVEKAVARHQELENQRLEIERQRKKAQDIERLYHTCFELLLTRFDSIAVDFNSRFQHGAIRRRHAGDRILYELPGAATVALELFSRRETGWRVAGGEIIGGALMGLEKGISANLLLLREDVNDFYGHWVGCLINVSALVHPRAAHEALSVTPPAVPFGFRCERDFYHEIVHAQGGMHIFTYEIWPDVEKLFWEFLDTAYTVPSKSP